MIRTSENNRIVPEALDLQVRYDFDEESGCVLASSVTPLDEGEIMLSPSRKSLHNLPNLWLTDEIVLPQ